MNAGIESCAGGVTESQQALSAVEAGATADLKTAIKLVNFNAANCSPANSQPLDDLTQYQVTESLASFNLQQCTNDFVTWAFPYAMQAQDGHGQRADGSGRARPGGGQRRAARRRWASSTPNARRSTRSCGPPSARSPTTRRCPACRASAARLAPTCAEPGPS